MDKYTPTTTQVVLKRSTSTQEHSTMLYNVYVTRNQISGNNRREGMGMKPGDNDTIAYCAKRRGNNRREAVDLCIADIWALCDDDIRIISVYAGQVGSITGRASRLTPIQYRR